MSSILKALEKAEESQNARRNGGAIGPVRPRERRPAWVLPAGILGGAAVAALITFAAMDGFSSKAAPALQAKAVENPAPVVAATLSPVAELPAAKPEQTFQAKPEQTLSVEPERALRTQPAKAVAQPMPKAKPAPAPKLAAKPVPVPAVALPVSHPASVHPSSVQAAPFDDTPFDEAMPEVAPAKTLAEIRVTGIAWQKDSKSSAAIVNGRPVQQGAMVDGYRVEQILEDSVRFSGSKGKLEVPLGGGQ